MDPKQREAVKAAFQADPKQSPVRILLATDAASEGIDLQNHCSRLIHYEIPWNPNRMEQRNGRIDRHGQKADRSARSTTSSAAASGSRAHRRLTSSRATSRPTWSSCMRAAKKVQAIREDLGKVGPVIAEQVEEAMLGRRQVLDTARAESDAAPVRRMLKFERDLREQIQRLRDQLDETTRELRLSPANVQHVVETALDLAGQPQLVPVTGSGRPSPARCSTSRRSPGAGSTAPTAFATRTPARSARSSSTTPSRPAATTSCWPT